MRRLVEAEPGESLAGVPDKQLGELCKLKTGTRNICRVYGQVLEPLESISQQKLEGPAVIIACNLWSPWPAFSHPLADPGP